VAWFRTVVVKENREQGRTGSEGTQIKEGTGSRSAWPGGGRCSRPPPTSPSAQHGLGPRPRGRFGKEGGGIKNENLLKNNYTLNRVGETSKTGEHFIGYEDLGENSDVVF